MKKILLLASTVLSLSGHASFFDFLNSNPSVANILRNSSNIQFGSSQSVGVVESSNEQQCIDTVQEALQMQKDEPNDLGLLSAAYLTSKAYPHYLEGSYTQKFKGENRFGSELKRGLSNDSFINANSYSSKKIPHETSGCSKFAKITSVTKSLIKNKTCRVVNYDLSGERYKVLFCENDHSVYTDFLDTESKILKTYQEIK